MKKYLFILFFLYHTTLVNSQDVVLKVEYPAVVSSGQQFAISWTVNSGGGEFASPPFTGFYKLMGPQTSYSSSTQIINGKMSQNISYTYVYYLQALKEGKYVIKPAEFTLKNKTYYSDSIYIEVINSGNTPQAQTGKQTNNSQVESNGNDIFVNLSLNRKEIYIGEFVVATVKIYTRVNISGINEIKYPSFNGFLKSEIETPPLTSLQQENVNGTIYGSGVVQQFLLYPQMSGELTLDPVQISVLVQQKSGQADPFFGDFFTSYQTVPKAVASIPMKVMVKPLPGSRPDDFSGLVGKIDLKASINKDTVDVNDAVNLRIVISGTGNLKIASTPSIKLSPDIETYDPKITDDIKNSIKGSSGQKTFEYLLIPRHYGDFTIPAISYSFFNTSTGQYETLRTKEFKFHARKGKEQNTGITVYGGISKEDVKYLGKDIRFIKSNSGELIRTGNLFTTKRSFYSAYLLMLFVFILVLIARREHIRRNADANRVRNRKAGKVAVKRLKVAEQCLKNNQPEKVYDEVLKAIWGYLSDKLSIPLSDLNRERALSELSKKGTDDNILKELSEILDKCEFARFAPSAAGNEASAIFDMATRFINSIEN